MVDAIAALPRVGSRLDADSAGAHGIRRLQNSSRALAQPREEAMSNEASSGPIYAASAEFAPPPSRTPAWLP